MVGETGLGMCLGRELGFGDRDGFGEGDEFWGEMVPV